MEHQNEKIVVAFKIANEKTRLNFAQKMAMCWINSKFMHTAVYFPKEEVAYQVVDDSDNAVYSISGKGFDGDNAWEFLTVYVSADKYQKVKEFCVSHHGDGYNDVGYWCFPLWSCCMPCMKSDTWICSQFVAVALEKGGVLREEDLGHTDGGHLTVEDLYWLIRKRGGLVDGHVIRAERFLRAVQEPP